MLFTIAGHTRRLQLGPVTTQPFFVHPALTAANLACLDELSGGRALIGLSRGFPFYLDMLSLKPKRPVTALKEAVEVIDRLLRGKQRQIDSINREFTKSRRQVVVMGIDRNSLLRLL